MSEELETIAKRFEEMAIELDKAKKHADIAANHFRTQEVPRGCAHAMAVQGHILTAKEVLEQFSKIHREHAQIS